MTHDGLFEANLNLCAWLASCIIIMSIFISLGNVSAYLATHCIDSLVNDIVATEVLYLP